MSSYMLNDVVLPVRIVAGVFCFLGTTTNTLVALLSIFGYHSGKFTFTLLIEIAAISNALVTLSGYITLNRCTNMHGMSICIALGPGAYLGERFCNILDSLVVHINSYNAVLVGWMMLVRSLLLFGIRLTKTTLILWTILIVLFPIPQFYVIVNGFIPSTGIPQEIIDAFRSDLEGRVFYRISIDPGTRWMWIVTSYIPLAVFIFCIPLRFAMEWKLNNFSANISMHTKRLHRSFLNMLTVDATVTFVYFVCCNDTVRARYYTLTKDIGYLMFSIPVFIQGFSTLYFVPSLRMTFRKMMTTKTIVTSASHISYN